MVFVVIVALLATIALPVEYAVGGWVVVATLFFLLRVPQCHVPPSPLGIVSPANGTVTTIETVHDPWLDRMALRIQVTMPLLGPYSLYSPTEGKVMERWFGHTQDDKDVPHITHAVWIQTDESDDLIIAIRPRLNPRKARCKPGIGERIGQGQGCGFMFGGGYIEILLDETSRAEIEVGQKITAGTDLLGMLIHDGTLDHAARVDKT